MVICSLWLTFTKTVIQGRLHYIFPCLSTYLLRRHIFAFFPSIFPDKQL